jgi:xanthosine utilization system XapX-like protein
MVVVVTGSSPPAAAVVGVFGIVVGDSGAVEASRASVSAATGVADPWQAKLNQLPMTRSERGASMCMAVSRARRQRL